MNRPFQRKGVESNRTAGDEFTEKARCYFLRKGLHLEPEFPVEIGINGRKRHKFDLGDRVQKILVECKSHKWTEGGHVPSAKMHAWNEAMFLFLAAPRGYRKILFVLRDQSRDRKEDETLGHYYVRTYSHLLPRDVEIYEFDEQRRTAARIR